MSERIRGRRAVRLRRMRLLNEPLCRHCKERGVVKAATVPDHIVPIAFGGEDVDENVQCLCEECHAVKTASEDTARGGSLTHPHWLKPSSIPLTIICGPPCSGKTTYIAEHASPGDFVIELDDIARRIEPRYQHWQGMLTGPLMNQAMRARNAMLGSLWKCTHRHAWFIVSAPTRAERDWWQAKLGGEIVLLHPGVEECKRRAVARGTPDAVQGIASWERKARQPWQPKRNKQPIGVDGWPLEDEMQPGGV